MASVAVVENQGVDIRQEACELPKELPKVEAFETPVEAFEKARNSFAAHGPAVFNHIKAGGAAGMLHWNDVCFSVKVKAGRKEILQKVSGSLHPGRLTCILGPSGSGKTTLLNTLSGRTRPGGRFDTQIAGDISLNGQTMQPWLNQHCFGYVMQEDCLYCTETVREVLTFAAKLRLNVESSQIKPLVEDMLASLGLQECADTMAGSDMIKGISGGQKKRACIAAELITNPAITFLDEPTSGLDTAAAYKVVTVLKELSRAQQSVLCTVHQPSSEIFELFDQAIFIAKGQIMYSGPPGGIRAHFHQLGHLCPEDYNPADFVMFTLEMNSADEAVFGKLAEAGKWCQADAAAAVNKIQIPPRPKGKGLCTELVLLAGRQYRNTIRDKASLGGRFGITIFMNVVFGLIFLHACRTDRDEYELQTHFGAITMVGINAMFGCVQPAILSFPAERPVFLREYASQMYGVVPYFLSKTLVEFVLLVGQVLLQLVIVHFMMGFHGNFGLHAVALFLIGASASSIGLFFGCSIRDIKTAMEITPLAFVPQILFAGFFIKMEQIPVFLRWLQYICGLKWGINIMLANEMGADTMDSPMITSVLKANNVEEESVYVYILVLIGLILVFRIGSVQRLHSVSKSVF